MFKKPLWQTVWMDPDSAIVCSGTTLFASILNLTVLLGNYLQQTTSADNTFRYFFSWGFKGKDLVYIIWAVFTRAFTASTCNSR